MALSAVLSAIPAVVQAGTGIYQAYQGNKLANSMERPDYSIPQEVLDNLTDSQIQALRGLPEEQRQQYMENIMRSAQTSISALGDRKGGLAGMSSVQQQQNDAYKNLLSIDAQKREENERNLQATRNTMSEYKDKQFQMNEMQPFQDTMAAAEGMQGAGIQNIMGGVTSGSKMGLDYMKYMELLNSMGSADVGKTGSALSEIPGGSGKSNGLLKMLQSFLGGGDPSNSSGSNISLPTP
jgi:hypothetical protein